MEPNRISSHLVRAGHRWDGSWVRNVGHVLRFREREMILRALRADHRPADELMPTPGRAGCAARPARRCSESSARARSRPCRPTCRRTEDLAQRERHLEGPCTDGVGYLDPTGCIALADHRTWCLRPPACSHDLRRAQPYCGYEDYEFDGHHRRRAATPTAGTSIRRQGDAGIARRSSSSASNRLEKLGPGPVMISDKKLAWPADLTLGPDGAGQLPRAHRQDHGPPRWRA